ncbi:hypothetical protein DMC47_13565 [Nostoc sp. 3335mG]|nr:hypothetical protein DMC47_13565 [Nostoc sp. 3335mG]
MPSARRLIPLLWDAARDRPQNRWMVTLAVALVMAPATMLFPITLGFFVKPLWMFEDWQSFEFFMLFYGLPWVLAAGLTYAAATVGEKRSGTARSE